MLTSQDSDTKAFVNILNQDPNGVKLTREQRYALDFLVNGLKDIGIWSKIKALYPMIGGTAYKHKFNLKDPRDLDAAFRLSFNGGWTHSSTGALPNGTTGYADTFFIPYNNLTVNDAHLSYYSRTNPTGSAYVVEIGAVRDLTGSVQTGNYQMDLAVKYYQDGRHQANIGLTPSRINALISGLDTAAYFLAQRTAVNRLVSYRNGEIIASSTVDNTGGALPTNSLYLCAKMPPSGALNQFSNRECILASVGTSMSDTEVALFNNVVQHYQSILSRCPGRS